MKISSVVPLVYEAALTSPISDARNTITHRSCVLVRVETDVGVTGWGEAASFAGCGALVAQTVRFYAERLVGREADEPERLYDEMYGSSLHFGRRGLVVNALSGIDVALWDIKAKSEGQPLYVLLGARRDRVHVYFNGGYFVDENPHGFLRSSVERAVDRGAKAVKIKIGRALDDDRRRIAIAREILGASRDLMVDANGTLDLESLLRLDPLMVDQRIRWMEEPVRLGAIRDLVRVRDALETPIAGYELEQTAQGWADLIEAGTVDVAQPDAIWSGGVTECRRTFSVAEDHGTQWVPHNFASVVSLAANAHLAAAAPTGGWLEVDSNENPFLWELNRLDTFGLEEGTIALPRAPGLGLEPDISRIEQYRVAA